VRLAAPQMFKAVETDDEALAMGFVWIGFAAFFCVSLAVGIRLLALAARTKRAPELLIGLGVLGIGPIGFGLQTLAGVADAPSLAEGLAAASAVAVAIGLWAKLVFNWSVYRRDSGVALAGAWLLALAVAAHLLVQPLLGSFLEATQSVRLNGTRGALQALTLGWGAAEAFRYWRLLRRRARLGLAEPELANRFLLWTLSAGAAGLGTAIGVAASLATGKLPLAMPEVLVSSSAHGSVAALGMWLAFAPPRTYLRWLAGSRARA